MLRSELLTVATGGEKREYTVWLSEDPPARRDAIAYFQSKASAFHSEIFLPASIKTAPIDEANEFLQRHPLRSAWTFLRIGAADQIHDDDLQRLRFLPELRDLRIWAPISDEGVRHLLLLPHLSTLVLNSPRVTNKCLESIKCMTSLRMIDLQCATGVSRIAFEEAVRQMNPMPDSWPPPASIAKARQ